MLSAFTARPILELKQRDKSKIESLLAYGDRLLIGLNTGSLRIYRVNELNNETDPTDQNPIEDGDEQQPKQPRQRPVDLLREEEKFSRRPVQQLAMIKEANILVSLSENCVSIHDLHSYALQERLEKTKGATSFAVTSNIVKDPSTGIPSIVSRLAVAVKRKIILWSWQDMELSDESVEMTLVSSVKSMTWATATIIVAGMDPGFVMVDIETQEIADINKPGPLGDAGAQSGVRFGAVSTSGMGYMGMGSWVPKPMATPLCEGQMLLARDVNTLFIGTDGKPLEKRQIPWATAPEAIGYSYPYMLALQPVSRGALDVRNPETLSLLQTISLPNANILHVPQPNISLAHAGKGFLVGSDRCIWRMGALGYDSQIDELVASARYDEAISLLSMLEDTLLQDKKGSLRNIKILKAQSLFDLRRYREALDLFSEAHAPPEKVISLYPKSIAGDLSTVESSKDSESEAEPEEPSAQESATSSKATISTPASSLGRSMLGKFRAEQKKADSDTASVRSLKLDSDSASIRGKQVEPDKPLEGRDLLIAVNELCAFLVQIRTRHLSKFINTDGSLKQPLPAPVEGQVEAPKPSFHYLLLPSRPQSEPEGSAPRESREDPASEPGEASPSEPEESALDESQETPQGESQEARQGTVESIDWEKQLREVAVLVDTTLFRAYMLARPALAGPLFRLDNFCDPAVVKEKLYETGRYGDLIDFLHGKKLHREALELLEKFGKDEAGEVTPALRGPQRTIGYLQQLPPEMIDLILEFIEWPLRTKPDLGMEVFIADTENAETLPRHRVLEFLQRVDRKLAVKYLEHIIDELNDLTPDFHQRLIDLYLERLQIKDGEGGFGSDEERKQWREKLQEFLKSSSQYNRARAFRMLPAADPDFFEARAIVLCNMGQHKQALQIYVFQIRDYQKAEEYCNQIWLNAHQTTSPVAKKQPGPGLEDSEPSIYHTLLSLYLSPPPPHEPNWPPALDLLSRHGARLPASSTLSLVPASLPVKELESYFRGRIRSANSVTNEERIVSRLRGVEKISVEAALLLGEGGAANGGRNRRVVITEDRHCAVCHKRFGGSIIRVYPDNSVVHYGCFNRPKVGGGADPLRRPGWG